MSNQEPVRISKLLSAHGIASRREAENMIVSGRVTVGGEKAKLGQRVVPESDEVAVDGVPIVEKCTPAYIMLNKPAGYLTTVSDDRGRKTVMSLVKGAGIGIYPIGRLDMDTEGLLLFTNDGAFANNIMHPSNNRTKVYEVVVSGYTDSALIRLSSPMQIDGHPVRADNVKYIGQTRGGSAISISIHEGRNRQIRKMCAQCGVNPISLKRVAIGPLELGNLPLGEWRHLTVKEVGFFG